MEVNRKPIRPQCPTCKGIDPYALWAIDTNFDYSQPSYVYDSGNRFVKFIAEVTPSNWALERWLKPWNPTGPDWLRVAAEYVESKTVDPRHCHFVTGYIEIEVLQWLLGNGQFPTPSPPPNPIHVQWFWLMFKRLQLAADVQSTVPFVGTARTSLIQAVSVPPAIGNNPDRTVAEARNYSDPFPLPTFTVTFAGVIDVGIPFANRECRDWYYKPPFAKSTPRLLAYWDQQDGLPPYPPTTSAPLVQGFNYGRDWYEGALTTPTIGQLVSGVVDVTTEEACYRRTHSAVALRARAHGAATLGELSSYRLSSNDDKNNVDPAGFVPLLAVQLPRPTMAHSSLGALSAHVLDGLRWLVARAGKENKLVTNISLGTQAGPHDGTSLLERAMDELIRLRKETSGNDRLAVVVAAGNSREARCHAEFPLARGKQRDLTMRVLPDSGVPVYMEVWHETTAKLSISIRDPAGQVIPFVPIGQMDRLVNGAGKTTASIYNMGPNSALGNHSVVLVAIASTSDGRAVSGDWTITAMADKAVNTCHAYVERNNSMFDVSRPQGRQARFVDPNYQIAGLSPVQVGDSPVAMIRRRGTLNSISTGAESLVAGAYAGSDKVATAYTGSGPTRGGAFGVDAGTMGDARRAIRGVRVLATRSGVTTRLNGSSIAAPRLARRVLNYLTGSGSDPAQTHVAKLALQETGSVQIDPLRVGYGVLDEARVEEPRLKHD